MPNWCNNTLKISHPDLAMMEKAIQAWNNGKFLSVMVPEPDYSVTPVSPAFPEVAGTTEATIRDDSWWDWRVQNWGTKWDIGFDPDLGNTAQISEGEMRVGFDSAWSPPTQAYDSLVEQGFSILAYYFEPGMDFCGRYEDGVDECYTASDGVPKDIDDEMCVSDTMSHYE